MTLSGLVAVPAAPLFFSSVPSFALLRGLIAVLTPEISGGLSEVCPLSMLTPGRGYPGLVWPSLALTILVASPIAISIAIAGRIVPSFLPGLVQVARVPVLPSGELGDLLRGGQGSAVLQGFCHVFA